jgi:SAM-dependent methyltransferase
MDHPLDTAYERYRQQRITHWDKVAQTHARLSIFRRMYHKRIEHIYRFLIPPGQRVLEIGCGRGDLLAALEPATGVGVDFSAVAIALARHEHPEVQFFELDAHDLSPLSGIFDAIIISNTLNDLWDVQTVFEQLTRFCHPGTRLIIDYYSHLWGLPLQVAQALGWANPTLPQNWLTSADVANLLYLGGFEVIRSWQEMLWPIPLPVLAGFFNRFLVRFWPFRHLALDNITVARPLKLLRENNPTVSVVIPARNEAGNIPALFERMPRMGSETELLFVEGHSLDDTYAVIEGEIRKNPEWKAQLFRQNGIGKSDAVRMGFSKASGDILMILDSDLTVPPEDLPRFFQALCSGRGELINGVRLVYPMEHQAMRALNFLGNKFFSMAFTWLLGQSIKDTLCGTKALWRSDYELIAANRSYFGDFDPFGDFDLIFGSAKLNRKILDLPIRYRERQYGRTNIDAWKHGWLLLRMVIVAARAIKFI